MTDLSGLMVYAIALRNAGSVLRAARRLRSCGYGPTPECRGQRATWSTGLPGTVAGRARCDVPLLNGSYADAIPYLRRAFDVATAAGLVEDAARWADNLTTAHASLGQWDEAERMNREATHFNQRAGTRTFIYNTFHRAEIATGRGQTVEARKLYEEVLADTTTPPALAWEAHAELGDLKRECRRSQRRLPDTTGTPSM